MEIKCTLLDLPGFYKYTDDVWTLICSQLPGIANIYPKCEYDLMTLYILYYKIQMGYEEVGFPFSESRRLPEFNRNIYLPTIIKDQLANIGYCKHKGSRFLTKVPAIDSIVERASHTIEKNKFDSSQWPEWLIIKRQSQWDDVYNGTLDVISPLSHETKEHLQHRVRDIVISEIGPRPVLSTFQITPQMINERGMVTTAENLPQDSDFEFEFEIEALMFKYSILKEWNRFCQYVKCIFNVEECQLNGCADAGSIVHVTYSDNNRIRYNVVTIEAATLRSILYPMLLIPKEFWIGNSNSATLDVLVKRNCLLNSYICKTN